MTRVQFTEHGGARLLVTDLSGNPGEAVLAEPTAEAIRAVATAAPRSLLSLVDFTGTPFDGTLRKHLGPMRRHNRPYMKKIALVGVTGVAALFLRTFLTVTRRTDHRPFATREEALEWLTENN